MAGGRLGLLRAEGRLGLLRAEGVWQVAARVAAGQRKTGCGTAPGLQVDEERKLTVRR